jgi:hypothetical protein
LGAGPRPEPAPDDAEVELWRDAKGAICARSYIRNGHGWVEVPGTGLFRLNLTNRKVTAFPDAHASRILVSDVYLTMVLPIALSCYGYEVLHASAVLMEGGVFGFCATSGTGKSTLAAAFCRNGCLAFADDALVLDFDTGRPAITAVSVPFSLRLPEGSVIRHTQVGGQCVGMSRPLAALCVLGRGPLPPSAPEVLRLPPIQAFSALLPHAYYFSLGDLARKRLMFLRYLDLVSRVPVYKVTFAADFSCLPELTRAVEQSIAAGDGKAGPSTAAHYRAGRKPAILDGQGRGGGS